MYVAKKAFVAVRLTIKREVHIKENVTIYCDFSYKLDARGAFARASFDAIAFAQNTSTIIVIIYLLCITRSDLYSY